jgi:hypothetical protein
MSEAGSLVPDGPRGQVTTGRAIHGEQLDAGNFFDVRASPAIAGRVPGTL